MKVRIGNLHNMCENNTLFLSRARNYFLMNGHLVVDETEVPDLFFIGGCTVTDRMRARCEEIILESMRKHPRACFVVFGCLAAFPERLLAEAGQLGASLRIVAFNESQKLDDLVHAHLPFASITANRLHGHFPYQPLMGPADCYVMIAQGCINACSYCNIKKAKGQVKSRSQEEIEAEVWALHRDGERTVTLLADDCGSYGLDRNTTLPELLTRLCQTVPDMRFKLFTIFPGLFLRYAGQLETFFSKGRIPYICLPAQSAAPRILALMNRAYDPGKLVEAVARIRELAPDTFVYSHFIYNFPSETWEEFEQSIALSRYFDHCVFIAYGENSATRAAGLVPKCSAQDLERKSSHLGKLIGLGELSAFLVTAA